MGQLDGSAVPPLVATLDSPDAPTVSAVAEALGQDRRPSRHPADLTVVATSGQPEAAKAAQSAIAEMTGRRFDAQAKPPIRVLDDAARAAFLALPRIPSGPENLWTWDDTAKLPVAKVFDSCRRGGHAGTQIRPRPR